MASDDWRKGWQVAAEQETARHESERKRLEEQALAASKRHLTWLDAVGGVFMAVGLPTLILFFARTVVPLVPAWVPELAVTVGLFCCFASAAYGACVGMMFALGPYKGWTEGQAENAGGKLWCWLVGLPVAIAVGWSGLSSFFEGVARVFKGTPPWAFVIIALLVMILTKK